VRRQSGLEAGWKLTDLIDVRTLQSIQDTFARAFGLPTVIVNPDGSNATDITHRVTFCEDLTRTSVLGGPRCAECDLGAMRKAERTAQPAIFKCWNGLYDCAIPITCKGETLGYFLCGQILMDAPDQELYRGTAQEIGVDPETYLQALADVRHVDFDSYEASVHSMQVLAEMIAEQAAAAVDNLATLEEAEQARADAARLMGELDAILEGLRDVGSQPDYRATLEAVAQTLDGLIPWDSCVIYVIDEARGELVPAVARDPYAEQVTRFRPRVGQSVVGKVALTGVGRRLRDVTNEPDFEPIPGVPLKPEAMLAVPMVYRDAVSGVIVLSRLHSGSFSDHEFQVLAAFSSQASVSIQLAKLASDNAEWLRQERAFSGLLRTISTASGLEAILGEAARTAAEVLGADAVVLQARLPDDRAAHTTSSGIAENLAETLLAELEPSLGEALLAGSPRVCEWRGRSALTLPFGTARDTHGAAVLLGAAEREWDDRVALALGSQLTLGLEQARLRRREARQLREYRQLSELGAELAQTADISEFEHRLLLRTRAAFAGDVAWLATLGDGPDAIAVTVVDGPRTDRFKLTLEGPGRVATLRLRDEPLCARSVYDAWAHEIYAEASARDGLGAFISEPLTISTGTLGGLFVGWRDGAPRLAAEQVRMLGLVASAAGASLARLTAYQQTDAALRERVSDLEGLAQLAHRLTGLREARPILDEVLSALRRIGGLDCAAYGMHCPSQLRIRRSLGLDVEKKRELLEAYGRLERRAEAGRVALQDARREAVFLPAAATGGEGAVFAGIGPQAPDPQRDRALQMIARYGTVALENAELHRRQRLAIRRLEHKNLETAEQTAKLKRVLLAHETLATAVVEDRGLASVASSLATFSGGEVAILAPDKRILAISPASAKIDWRPPEQVGLSHPIVEEAGGAHLIAAPAVVESEPPTWVIVALRRAPDDVDKSAIEYAAMLTTLELLRERTADEVETRLRGDLLDELFGNQFVEELIAKQAGALGLDLNRPSRVILVEATAPAEADPASATDAGDGVDPERLLPTVREAVNSASPGGLVALRGQAVVAIAPENAQEDAVPFEDRLRPALRAWFPRLTCAIAVGTLCTTACEYEKSFLAARRGLDLLKLQRRYGETITFRDAGVTTLLLRSTEPEVVLEFVSRYVEPLDRYDARHKSELRATAETYFDTGGNLEEAARRLHVHVSTLRYRLGRITELTGVNLRDPRATLDLQVALRAVQPLAVRGW
jgi:ligand-binding sensor protein/sugar diacid utilization regulator/GAF domain-containing protein